MWNRVAAVFRAGFAGQWGRGAWPVAPFVVHGSIAAVFALLVRDELPPFAFALFQLSLAAALIALPLLGDFAVLLRADPASEWIEAQPVRRRELRLARTLLVLVLVGALSLATALPTALFAPQALDFGARCALVAAVFAQAVVISAALLGIQSVLGSRAEALLVLIQTLLVGGILVGCVLGVRFVPTLLGWSSPASAGDALAFFPPAWFAALSAPFSELGLAWKAAAPLAFVTGVLVLALAPLPRAARSRRASWLAVLLAPARWLATRLWVRREERASFDLVYDALPLEREFVLRTYPMLGIPLAFLFVGARGASGAEREALLALLLFTPAIYLPILLVHVPASQSAAARWILDSAPVPASTIANGALKAITVRFLVPLYALLLVLAATMGSVSLAARLVPIGFAVSVLVTRKLYAVLVSDPPLSVPPDEVHANMDWTGILLTLAIALTLLSIVAFKFVRTPVSAAAILALLVGMELVLDRNARRPRATQ